MRVIAFATVTALVLAPVTALTVASGDRTTVIVSMLVFVLGLGVRVRVRVRVSGSVSDIVSA